jgi:hypothetical protein
MIDHSDKTYEEREAWLTCVSIEQREEARKWGEIIVSMGYGQTMMGADYLATGKLGIGFSEVDLDSNPLPEQPQQQ